MSFEIIRNDIVNMRVDAIVNTANPKPVVGSGVDAAIHARAGSGLLEARRKIGEIAVGSAAITDAYGLDAQYVIHAVGPVWRGGLFGEAKKLRGCYDAALRLALEHGCRSIAFPLISTGVYGFPKDKALQIAISAFSEFLMEHELQIYLVVFNKEAVQLSEKLFSGVASYIDEHYVAAREAAEYGDTLWEARRSFESMLQEESAVYGASAPMEMPEDAPDVLAKTSKAQPQALKRQSPEAKTKSLEELLQNTDAGFAETLFQLIDEKGKKDSEIYKKANMTRQHFSKIRNNPDYKLSKVTAVSLALALELDLEQTKDLIGRAGYAFTNSSKFDLIIRYFIEQKKYNVVEINMALYEFDQSLLGNGS